MSVLETPGASARTAPLPTADAPRRLAGGSLDDRLTLVGASIGSLAVTWLAYSQLLGWQGRFGFAICWYLAMLTTYCGLTALTNPWTQVVDRFASTWIVAGAAVVGLALASTVAYTAVKGLPAVVHMNFFTQDGAAAGPTTPLGTGGILHAIAGTGIEVAIATAVSLPLGVGTALYLTEVGGRGTRLVRTVVEAMTALPDVLAGLFVYVVLILGLGQQRSGIAAALALAIMMTPIIARSAEVQLRVVPGGLREAGLALGASQWQTVRRVVLPTARSGLATALILGVARAVGETAPVLITSGSSTFFNADPLHNPMNSLPLYILFAVRSGQNLAVQRGWGAALVLLLLVLVLFVLTRLLARQKVAR